MPELDRGTARALTEAGYMPLRDYIRMYGDVEAAEAAAAANHPDAIGALQPSGNLIDRVASPLWAARYGVTRARRRTHG